jgi:ABC-type thiamin/hydroxymethylpyrimidine transport system permease subunit
MKFVEHSLSKTEIYRSAVFGVVWGIIEITAGNALHLAKVPFRGFLLSFIAAIVLVTAKGIIQYKGSLIVIGIICATLKTATTGAFLINPIAAILLESLLAEMIFIYIRTSPLNSIIAGSAVMLYTFLHSLIAQLFFFGTDIFTVYAKFFHALFSDIDTHNLNIAIVVLSIYGIFHIVIGAVAGIIGYRFAIRTTKHIEVLQNAK